MFKQIFEIGSLVKHAKELGGRVQEMNEQLRDMRAEGTAAGGLVSVCINGLQEMISCKIDPAVFQQGDAELLEELVVDAVNNAIEESRSQQTETMKSLTDGFDMSSLSEMLSNLSSK